MALLTHEEITDALTRLGELAQQRGESIELLLMGGAVRRLLSEMKGTKDQVWSMVEPYLVPGRELKAQYAFEDLWEVSRGTD